MIFEACIELETDSLSPGDTHTECTLLNPSRSAQLCTPTMTAESGLSDSDINADESPHAIFIMVRVLLSYNFKFILASQPFTSSPLKHIYCSRDSDDANTRTCLQRG